MSGTFQNLAGAPWLANYSASNALIETSLGRPLAGGRRSATVPLIEPFSLFEPRRNLLDLRVSKVFSDLGPGVRVQLNFDIYNVINDASVLRGNDNFGTQWLRPSRNGVAAARLIQMGGKVSF